MSAEMEVHQMDGCIVLIVHNVEEEALEWKRLVATGTDNINL